MANNPHSPDDFTILSGIRLLMDKSHRGAAAKGFWERPNSMGESIALMHSELSEALEADRNGDRPSDHIPEFSGVAEEFADTIIRICDVSQYHGIDLASAILAKLSYNMTRPHKHGGKKY